VPLKSPHLNNLKNRFLFIYIAFVLVYAVFLIVQQTLNKALRNFRSA